MMKTKIVILFGILGIFLASCTAGRVVNSDAGQVAYAAAEIADLDLPDGYRGEFSARLAGYTVAAFHPGDGHSHLYLIQSEKAADREKLAAMLAELAPGASDPQTRMTVTETRAAIVRGQETKLIISEGVNSEGAPYRQATAAFQGNGGPALLVFSEPIERWNQTAVDTLLASIQ